MSRRESFRPRGFGFVTFSAEEPVELLVSKRFVEINKKQVEIKAALPKSSMGDQAERRGRQGGRGGGNRGQGSYGYQYVAFTTTVT